MMFYKEQLNSMLVWVLVTKNTKQTGFLSPELLI